MSNARPLSDEDVDGFLDAAGRRSQPSMKKRERVTFIATMQRRSPLRMRRLQADLRWLLKHAARQGVDKDELRWMLW